ncbi:MAG: 3D/G5 domain-containing protein [candidate division WS6 bacterium GW2011_GWC1_33_20]|uniref:G5 domain-containing protein n=2 Tax=Candidatus Dojkabacteria TaxID=74243 RepID=A0A0G0ACX9_9BACT|nr:MAG: 3D/G5 domain-containing protein [candidate division WS6 bacterium GW2011_GWE2_33_157]KKP44571.1 MAG: 3D/G5 domain-containing protein [candidate division WS6 bacterium GW2011_GWC1_33_20]KKP54669.1 MAG: hypothetical protein UR47_C0013G0049 [candidate division WS6 bacterium GW2011_GWB1_33_6]OGC35946.1 MAG: hypothetical protein A2369_02560 [candidate division WS6 bacterium RIFOXYB1_FULL_33_15]HBB64801.1 hypothetical protein [Patescibacteria group bacterium]
MKKEKLPETDNINSPKIYSFPILFLGILVYFLLIGSKNYVFANKQKEISPVSIGEIFYGVDKERERDSGNPKIVSIKKNDNTYKILTTETDIHKVLKENNIQLEKKDVLSMSTEYVKDGSIVRIVSTDRIIVQKIFDIPYAKEIVKSESYLEGDKRVIQEGVLGVRVQRVLNYYEDGVLISSEIIDERVEREPIKQIVEVGVSWYSLDEIEKRGYDCGYWYSVVDSGSFSDEEKRWLKFIMYCESGCNAESNKSNYKGLFQWSPYWWRKQFPENIFDGHAQIKHTIEKYRAGESTRANQWPACHASYNRTY